MFLAAGLRPLEPYPGARNKWKSECINCGAIVSPAYSSVQSGASKGCAQCALERSRTLQKSKGRAIAVKVLAENDLELRGEYENAKTPIEVSCLLCGKLFQTTQSSVKSGAVKCECKKVARRPLIEHHPELAAEVHPTRNLNLSIRRIGTGMKKSIWWICRLGHEFQNSPSNRVYLNQNCPYCEGSRVVAGETDLATLYPEIFSQLKHKKHEALHPKSNKKLLWVCSQNPTHEYEAQIYERVVGQGCPYCAGKKVMRRENDLATLRPHLVDEWDYERNIDRPEHYSLHSNKKKWWRCTKNPDSHRWKVAIASRSKGNGCPYCGNQKLLTGDNDLSTLHPEIAALWHPTKNSGLRPKDLIAGSNKAVWWQCPKHSDHAWKSPPSRLLTQGSGCPVCSNYQLLEGFNDLASRRPELASEWARDLNDLDPSEIVFGSRTKVWWRCQVRDSHVWRASPMSRRNGKGCPFCGGRRVDPGFNDLASQAPKLADEWDFDGNNGLTPENTNFRSPRKASWICKKDPRHKWSASIVSRVRGNGCPVCTGFMTIPGVNDLQTKSPSLAEEWVSERNSQNPSEVSPGSTSKVWWQCREHPDHQWQASVSSRYRLGSGCPICANLKVLEGFNDFLSVNPDIARDWHATKNTFGPHQVVSGTNKMAWWQCPSVPEHTWRASIKNRVRGKGCPQCAPAGYSTAKPGTFYFLKHRELGAMKIGITNGTKTQGRLLHFQRAGWEILGIWTHHNGEIALGTETASLRWIRKDLALPPYLAKQDMPRTGGWSETFSSEAINAEKLISQLGDFWNSTIANHSDQYGSP